jgi:hypothetical protein
MPEGLAISGVVFADHVKSSADWAARRTQFMGKAPAQVPMEVTAKLRPFLAY